MLLPLRIAVDPVRGAATIGSHVVAIESVGEGALRVGGARGPTLRPLRFGERARVIAAASRAAIDVEEAVCLAVATAATVSQGEGDRLVIDVIALVLAGAAEDAPRFDDAGRLVGERLGWDAETIEGTIAIEIDRCASRLLQEPSAMTDDWTAIVFPAEEPDDLRSLRAILAGALVRRARDLLQVAAEAAPLPPPPKRPEVGPVLALAPVERPVTHGLDRSARITARLAERSTPPGAPSPRAPSLSANALAAAPAHAAPSAFPRARSATRPAASTRPSMTVAPLPAIMPLRPDVSPRQEGPLRPVDPARTSPATPLPIHHVADDLADALAEMLEREADLRGIDR